MKLENWQIVRVTDTKFYYYTRKKAKHLVCCINKKRTDQECFVRQKEKMLKTGFNIWASNYFKIQDQTRKQ